MSIQELKHYLIRLSHDIAVIEKPEQKQVLRRKWNAFLNIVSKKTEDNIIELNEHIKAVERHIQILVMNHPDFYHQESYIHLNEDKIHTQNKLSEMRSLRECCSNQISPEDFWLKSTQMQDVHSDKNESHYSSFLDSAYNSDSDLYAKKSPQVHSLSTSTTFKNPPESQILKFLPDNVVPPPDLEYKSTLLRQITDKDFPTASLLLSKSDPLQPSFDVSERKRSKTLSDIYQPPLFDSQKWNGSQEESCLVYPSKKEMPFVIRENLTQEQVISLTFNFVSIHPSENYLSECNIYDLF